MRNFAKNNMEKEVMINEKQERNPKSGQEINHEDS